MTKGVFTFSPAACPQEAFSGIAPAYAFREGAIPNSRDVAQAEGEW